MDAKLRHSLFQERQQPTIFTLYNYVKKLKYVYSKHYIEKEGGGNNQECTYYTRIYYRKGQNKPQTNKGSHIQVYQNETKLINKYDLIYVW